jgi:hypothetical protein
MAHAAVWYRRDDYERIRSMMDDGPKLPATFDEWERMAKSQLAQTAASGLTLQKVILRIGRPVRRLRRQADLSEGINPFDCALPALEMGWLAVVLLSQERAAQYGLTRGFVVRPRARLGPAELSTWRPRGRR